MCIRDSTTTTPPHKLSTANISAISQRIELKFCMITFMLERIQPIDSKQWPCSTVVFHAVLQNLKTLCGLYLSHFSTDWAEILRDCFLGGKDPSYRFKTVTLQHCSIPCSAAESLNTLWPISKPFLNRLNWNIFGLKPPGSMIAVSRQQKFLSSIKMALLVTANISAISQYNELICW